MKITEKSKRLSNLLGYEFKSLDLLKEALTHKSFCINDYKYALHNERLEFLGDALLGSIMAEELMRIFPQDQEGSLSKKRASLVNQEILAQKAKKFELDQLIIFGPGEREQESHLKPRILASAFEALIGALYLDAEFTFLKAWIQKEFDSDIQLIKPDFEFERDYKTRLQELTQKLKLGTPEYKLISMTGPSHQPEFLVGIYLVENQNSIEKFRASGPSKKAAEQKVAQMLIDSLPLVEVKKKAKSSDDDLLVEFKKKSKTPSSKIEVSKKVRKV